ncbi:MAG TPA: phosphate acyltransferase [Syntrophales bacterium]|nr:phosphate acyltransferase [Syntrophales bacterium]
MITNYKMLMREAAARGPKKFAVIEPHERASIKAINDARKKGMAEGILIGQARLIESLLKSLKIPASHFDIRNEDDDASAAECGVRLAAAGDVDIILKGSVSTGVLLSAALRGVPNLRTGNILCDVLIFEDKRNGRRCVTLVSDGSVNIAPDLKAKLGIIRNAVMVAHALGIKVPKVAILSSVEKVQPEIQSSVDAAALAKICSFGEIPGCTVDGPFALDNAISAKSAKIKKVESPVAGAADILIAPNLEAGNMFCKGLIYYGGKDLAHAVVGAKVPILTSSRSDPPSAILASIAFGVVLSASKKWPA